MATQTLTAATLAAGIALGASGTIATQQASADKILYVKAENTQLKVANFTQVTPGEWVLVVCGVMHTNDGVALPETCHECPASFPALQTDIAECHARGEGLIETE